MWHQDLLFKLKSYGIEGNLFGLLENYLHNWKQRVILDSQCSFSKSSHPEVFLRKGFLKTCSNVLGERPCRSVISIKLLRNLIEITFQHGCSPVNLMYIFRTPFLKNTTGRQLLLLENYSFWCTAKFCFWGQSYFSST